MQLFARQNDISRWGMQLFARQNDISRWGMQLFARQDDISRWGAFHRGRGFQIRSERSISRHVAVVVGIHAPASRTPIVVVMADV
jgi:hypothetical protein